MKTNKDTFKIHLNMTLTVEHVTANMVAALRVHRVALDSSVIRSATYRPAERTLDIEMISGRTYRYADVPEWVFDELTDTSSAGHFYNCEIKGHYACEEITA